MTPSLRTAGVLGGIDGEIRSLYWHCPECDTPFEWENCSTVPVPHMESCDFASKHVTKAPIQFEVDWGTEPLGGTVAINGREVRVICADCFLFNGSLDIDFRSRDEEGACSHIPFGDAVEFSELSGQSISIADCINATYENPLIKPYLSINHEYYSILSLDMNAISFKYDSKILSFHLVLKAKHDESGTEISVQAQLTALCRPVDRLDLLHRGGPIPIRFAKWYLPLLGLPEISAGATRADVVSIFGAPDREGGGKHPVYGDIPFWILYLLPQCFLRLQVESEVICDITIMPREGPLALILSEALNVTQPSS